MKYLMVLFLVLSGCKDNNEYGCTHAENCLMVKQNNLDYFLRSCKALAKCMGYEHELFVNPSQKDNPYGCSVRQEFNGVERNRIIYPSGRISFGKFEFRGFENEILTCELIKRSGQYSDEKIKQDREAYQDFLKSKQENKTIEKERL